METKNQAILLFAKLQKIKSNKVKFKKLTNDSDLFFDSKLSWLYPIVEYVSELPILNGGDFHFVRTNQMNEETGLFMFRFNACGLHKGESRIEAMFNAVFDFIDKYEED